MGQKVNPRCFRTGPTLIKSWDSILYSDRNYGDLLIQDLRIREMIIRKHKAAQVSRVLIERPSNQRVIINIYARKPGVVIGKSGSDIDSLKKEVVKMTSGGEVYINIHEVKKPDIDAALIAEGITQQLEKRIAFRRAMKRAMQSCMKQGARGIKVSCSGRLAGAEIARTEWYREGRVPLHTLRADIDYATAEALTTYGIIGVKVWVYKGESTEGRKRHNSF